MRKDIAFIHFLLGFASSQVQSNTYHDLATQSYRILEVAPTLKSM